MWYLHEKFSFFVVMFNLKSIESRSFTLLLFVKRRLHTQIEKTAYCDRYLLSVYFTIKNPLISSPNFVCLWLLRRSRVQLYHFIVGLLSSWKEYLVIVNICVMLIKEIFSSDDITWTLMGTFDKLESFKKST